MSILSLSSHIPPVYRYVLDSYWEKLKLVPYRGYGRWASHFYLNLLYDLAHLSPTHATCIKDLREIGFMGDIDLEIASRAGLKKEPVEMGNGLKEGYCDFIEKLGFNLHDISNLSQCLFTDKKITGNAYLHCRIVRQAGVFRVFFKKIGPKHVMYLDPQNDNDPRTLFVSRRSLFDFENGKLFGQFISDTKDENYRLIRTFPHFTETKNVTETIFHFRNNDGESDFYGMPDTLHTHKSQIVDAQLEELSCKTTATEFVAKKLLALKRMGGTESKTLTKEDFNTLGVEIRNLATNEGKVAKSLGLISLPSGIEEIQEIDLAINRDTADFEAKGKRAIRNIYSAHGVDLEITGLEQSRSSLGDSAITNVFVKYDHKVVRSLQSEMSNDFLKVNQAICDIVGEDKFRNVRYIYPRKTDAIQEDLNSGNNGNINSLGGGTE